MGNIFGKIFRVATFGESHGAAVGCVIDGCPSRIPLSGEDIQRELDRRRPGQSAVSTLRAESDACKILSGVYEGLTLGTPICVIVENCDQRSGDYSEIAKLWRPSHADFTYDAKYGLRDPRGGGRSSARETIGRVAAGAVARKILGDGVESARGLRASTQSRCPSPRRLRRKPKSRRPPCAARTRKPPRKWRNS